jgi:hypothetical protein
LRLGEAGLLELALEMLTKQGTRLESRFFILYTE